MRYYEVEGDSPEIILTQFLNQQDIPKEYVEYEVLDAGSRGLLGIGRRKAKLKIKYNDAEHIKRRARMVLADILEKACFEDAHVSMEGENDDVVLNIDSSSPEILIGRTAQTLDALQYIMDKMLRLDENSDVHVTIDVDGYRRNAVAQNIEKALFLAEQVKRTGKTVKLAPMVTIMRKEIHIALKSVQGVSTMSVGEGQIKQICIVSDKKNTVSRKPQRRGGRQQQTQA